MSVLQVGAAVVTSGATVPITCPENSSDINEHPSSPRTLPRNSFSLGASHRGLNGEERVS